MIEDETPIENFAQKLLKLPHDEFEHIIQTISEQKMAKAISYAESNRAKHLLKRIKYIDETLEKNIYKLLRKEQRHQVKQLFNYTDDEVGAYMHLELLTATTDETVLDVKTKIRMYEDKAIPHAVFHKLFITTKKELLLYVLDITKLILYDDLQTIESIIAAEKLQKAAMINEHADIHTALKLFEKQDLSTLGVVDKKGRLLGRLLFDDAYVFIRVEEEKQALNMLGTHHEAEKSFSTAQRKRLEWIFINLCAILLSALVVNHFKGTIEQIVTLAVLMPVVAALGGDVGNQAVTVTVRRLALGEISRRMAYKIMGKEFLIGVVNGIIVGAVVGILAYFWFHQPMLGAVVTLAIVINLSLAGLIGSFLPIIMKRFNIDPAIASPLLLTTATDAMGFFVFLGLATLILLK